MTYAAFEKSGESGHPVELYHFVIGTTNYRYTSAETSYSFGSQTWLPRQIKHTPPSQSSEERRQQMEITMPTSDPVASRFIGIVPGLLMSLSIIRVHRLDPDQEGLVIWDGRITGASYSKDGVLCTLQGLTTEAAFNRSIPRYTYQGMCNHVLYDGNCSVDRDSFKYIGEVTGVSGNTITVDGLGATHPDQWAQGGYVELSANDWRLILDHTGNVLTLLLDFEANALGQNVSVFAGCDHSITTCESKFSNDINFGGFPYIPTRNPFESGVN